ncbi:MAG: hypothetical protein IK083_03025 [Abditibacteriota bacterium]|nr:hypothetical protein [Abditibacteriota bacterium]
MEERIYRIVDPNNGEGMLYTLGQLEHLKNNGKINADTLIKREGEQGTMPAGALFDFDAPLSEWGRPDTTVNILGIVSVVLIFFLPLAGLVTSIVGLHFANQRKQNRNMLIAALIINAILVFISFALMAIMFVIFGKTAGWDVFFHNVPHVKWI